MWQELFRIPLIDMPVYGYGLMLVLGVLGAIYVAKVLARQRGIDPEVFVNAGLLAMLSGIVGARLSHVLEEWGAYFPESASLGESLLKIINIRSGGLTYYGGFLLAVPVLLLYGRMKKVPLRVGMDITAPCIMIGLALGRVGCFLNGCCYGAECEFGVRFPYYSYAYMEQVEQGRIRPPAELMAPVPGRGPVLLPPESFRNDATLQMLARQQHSLRVHPAQLYSTVTGLLLAWLLLAYFPCASVPGRTFALMLILEPITRFLLEMLRVEPAVWGGMSFSMVLAIPQTMAGLLLWWGFAWYARRK